MDTEPMYRVGDTVRIRDWNDMASEFGTDWSGDIKVQFCFTKHMKWMCSKSFVITGINTRDYRATRYYLEGADGWSFSQDMFEPKDDVYQDVNTADIFSVIIA